MELGLTIAVVAGLLLFAIGFIRFVLAGFSHHFVTGIISLVPVLNLLVVPSVWHRAGKLLVTGLIGLLIALGAWFAGGDKASGYYLAKLTGKGSVQEMAPPSASQNTQLTSPLALPSSSSGLSPAQQPDSALSTTTPQTSTSQVTQVVEYQPSSTMISFDEAAMQPLPPKALYRLGFDEIPLQNIAAVSGRIVRITDQNLNLIEGRVVQVSASSVLIKPTGSQGAEVEIPVPNIKQLSLMVRKM